jgi:predicted nuclease with RNAse H fold
MLVGRQLSRRACEEEARRRLQRLLPMLMRGACDMCKGISLHTMLRH